ncbi:MAG: hypothetical protein WBD55_11210 [Dehalococcoidia bacterium]
MRSEEAVAFLIGAIEMVEPYELHVNAQTLRLEIIQPDRVVVPADNKGDAVTLGGTFAPDATLLPELPMTFVNERNGWRVATCELIEPPE